MLSDASSLSNTRPFCTLRYEAFLGKKEHLTAGSFEKKFRELGFSFAEGESAILYLSSRQRQADAASLLDTSLRALALAVIFQSVQVAIRAPPGCTIYGRTILITYTNFGCSNLAVSVCSRVH